MGTLSSVKGGSMNIIVGQWQKCPRDGPRLKHTVKQQNVNRRKEPSVDIFKFRIYFQESFMNE